jgi:calcineurin-like phosphoesterase family protein
MAKKFYTADWHLGSHHVLEAFNRPFSSIERMNKSIISTCNNMAPSKSDIVIHVGDFACFKKDRGKIGLSENPNKILQNISSTFFNIEGNHDTNNKVRSIGNYLRTTLGPFVDVSVSHYPSNDERAKGTFLPGDIHLCGHVHNKWKYFIDKENQVLNINVGIDVWGYRPVSEDKLIDFIKKLMKEKKN